MSKGFNWILPNQLAGSGRPGLYNEAEEDIEFIQEFGFNKVISLTEDALEPIFYDNDFEVIHFPISDMYVPRLQPTQELCTQLKKDIQNGQSILVHCKAGLGRTGTIEACILVELGHTGDDAIVEVRKKNSWAIQNSIQEGFIRDYHKFIHK